MAFGKKKLRFGKKRSYMTVHSNALPCQNECYCRGSRSK